MLVDFLCLKEQELYCMESVERVLSSRLPGLESKS